MAYDRSQERLNSLSITSFVKAKDATSAVRTTWKISREMMLTLLGYSIGLDNICKIAYLILKYQSGKSNQST